MLFGSSSKSNQTTNTTTEDSRIVAEGGALALNSDGGDVSVHFVADEAFDLAEAALTATSETLAAALRSTQAAARTESAQIGEQIVKIGIPAAALVFAIWSLTK